MKYRRREEGYRHTLWKEVFLDGKIKQKESVSEGVCKGVSLLPCFFFYLEDEVAFIVVK